MSGRNSEWVKGSVLLRFPKIRPVSVRFGREELRVLRIHGSLVKRTRMVLERAPNNLANQGFD
jgi:hypothetical protein